MKIETISDFRRAMRHGPYAWPGGYPTYFVTADGAALSYDAARFERRNILAAIASNDARSGWRVMGMDINWEDTELTCDCTGAPIPSAYEACRSTVLRLIGAAP